MYSAAITKASQVLAKAAANPQVRKAAAEAGIVLSRRVIGQGGKQTDWYFTNRRAAREASRQRTELRLRAMRQARQCQGFYSEDLVVAGDERYVVWRGDKTPVSVFPSLESDQALEDLEELMNVPDELKKEPPPIDELWE